MDEYLAAVKLTLAPEVNPSVASVAFSLIRWSATFRLRAIGTRIWDGIMFPFISVAPNLVVHRITQWCEFTS